MRLSSNRGLRGIARDLQRSEGGLFLSERVRLQSDFETRRQPVTSNLTEVDGNPQHPCTNHINFGNGRQIRAATKALDHLARKETRAVLFSLVLGLGDFRLECMTFEGLFLGVVAESCVFKVSEGWGHHGPNRAKTGRSRLSGSQRPGLQQLQLPAGLGIWV